MPAELIGQITNKNIPVYHLKAKEPKFRLAIVQADFAPGHTREADNTPQKHADIVSALMAATIEGETRPDLILFQELSMLGGVERIGVDRGLTLSALGFRLLHDQAKAQKVAIGFGGFFEMGKQYYNSYVVLPKGMTGPLFSCTKFTPINQWISQGDGYNYLSHFNTLVSQCSDLGYTNLVAFIAGGLNQPYSLLIVPAYTSKDHDLFRLSREPHGLNFQGPIAVINGMNGNSGYDTGNPTTSHIIPPNQEAVLVADVVL